MASVRATWVALVVGSLGIGACAEEAAEDGEHDTLVDEDTKADSVWFVEDNSWDSEAVLRLVNRADYATLYDKAGLTRWPARAIADAPKPIKTLAALDDISWVGPHTFYKLKTFAIENGYGPALGEEYAPDGEAKAIDQTMLAMSGIMLKKYASGAMPRGQHAKGHGCVQATFEVDANVPSALKAGVFAQAGSFRAIARFSNGDSMVKADSEKDVRGLAIKLVGVPGTKILPEEANATTQDFLLINHPTLMVRNVLTYADFINRANSSNQFSILTFFLSLNIADWELRGLSTLLSMISHKVANPLDARYFSTTPSKLGATAVKYSARPCTAAPAAMVPANPGPNFLREALQGQLRTEDACFEFLVQPQTDARAMPIEDPTIEWSEQKSPFVKVATLRIPAQTFDTPEQNTACENLTYTPWHSLEAHRPLGGINRARKAVYHAISVLRHGRNGAPRVEPQ
jgi:hypothetical protein